MRSTLTPASAAPPPCKSVLREIPDRVMPCLLAVNCLCETPFSLHLCVVLSPGRLHRTRRLRRKGCSPMHTSPRSLGACCCRLRREDFTQIHADDYRPKTGALGVRADARARGAHLEGEVVVHHPG